MSSTDILPFALFHNINDCYIATCSSLTECDYTKLYNTQGGWKLASIFFAVNPLFRPIPDGMQLFCAKRNPAWPYQTISLEMVYDVFNDYSDGTYFITYTMPVPNTTPMYIWNTNSTTFVDFSPKAPPMDADQPLKPLVMGDVSSITENSVWKLAILSPIYVLHPSIVGDDYTNIKFQCNNGECIPFVREIVDMYNPQGITTPKLLHQCLVDCSQVGKDSGHPRNIIALVKAHKSTLGTTLGITLGTMLSIIGIGIGIILCILIVIIILRKYKR